VPEILKEYACVGSACTSREVCAVSWRVCKVYISPALMRGTAKAKTISSLSTDSTTTGLPPFVALTATVTFFQSNES
jgi:hypothetical protein